MGITTEQYKKIIRFLDAEMGLAEMGEFEKELTSNPDMRNQLDFEQSLRNDFAARNITSLPGPTSVKESPAARATPGKITGMRIWLAISAAIIIAFMLFTIFWQKPVRTPDVANGKNMDTTQIKNNPPQVIAAATAKDSSEVIDLPLLFKQYFKKDTVPGNYPLYLAEALMDYESGNYKTLQQLNLNDLPQTRSSGETDSKENILQLGHYYKGLAFLQTNNTRDAIIHLNWVVANRPDKTLQAKARWHLALIYLKENNRKKAVELCRSIVGSKENPALVKNAEKILDTLGK